MKFRTVNWPGRAMLVALISLFGLPSALAQSTAADDAGGILERVSILDRLGIAHSFDVYEGTHTIRVREQFENRVLPFFARYLEGN